MTRSSAPSQGGGRLLCSQCGYARVRQREHPVIVEAAGRHADADWAEFLDPDGIALRMAHNAAGPRHLLGVLLSADGTASTCSVPRSNLPPRPAMS